MNSCPQCGAELDDMAEVCPGCMSKLTDVYCPTTGFRSKLVLEHGTAAITANAATIIATSPAPDTAQLATVLRQLAETLTDDPDYREKSAQPIETQSLNDSRELILVLARICEGKPLLQAFGAPGDWGYSSNIGKALAHAYGCRGY